LQRVKLRLVNDGLPPPDDQPFHTHGAGRCVVLARRWRGRDASILALFLNRPRLASALDVRYSGDNALDVTRFLKAALAAVAFLLASAGTFVAYWFLIALAIVVSGGAIFECDRGDCGGAYLWVEEHNLALLILGAVLSLAAGSLTVWAIAHKGRGSIP